MRCPICGTKNKNDAVECVACGSALTPETSETQSEKTTTQKKNNTNKNGSKNSNKNKKSGKNTQTNSEQVVAEEPVHDPAAEQGVIPNVVIIGKEKEHIPMNIEYSLQSEKFLEEDDDEDDDSFFGDNKKKKAAKPLISGSDTAIYICMGILGFLLVFAISYLAINIVLQDMGNETQESSSSVVADNTTESSSNDVEPSTTVDGTEDSTAESSSEEETGFNKGPWDWEDTYKIEIVDSEVYLLDYLGDEAIVRIPSEFDGYPLTMIEATAFMCSNVKAVEVPDGVTYISEYAFAECEKLEVIALPESLIGVGENAFDGIDHTIEVYCTSNTSEPNYGFHLALKNGFKWVYGKGLPEDISERFEEETTPEETTPEETTPEETTPEETTAPEETTESSSSSNTGVPSTSDFVQATFPAEGTYTKEDYYETEWIFRVLTLADGSQEVVVVRYRGVGGVVTVPSEYNGIPVRYIGRAAFQNQGDAAMEKPEVVTELIIPDSVVYIDYHGMESMKGCASITIPASVTYIYDNALNELDGTIIKVQNGSYAHAYCNEHPDVTYEVQ